MSCLSHCQVSDLLQSPVLEHDAIAPPLNQLSEQVAASSKTISRIFNRETGMPYQAWRQQWRLLKSIEKLSLRLSVADVAHLLEFSSDSAFIAFFKQQTGQTPYQYINQSPTIST
ncbi:helix-turn-helix transcriptional regulator [Vibrio sp. 404]|uniref:Helix-turn-helix transcriptional regulator n=1 Tax=Vibrio marinisediminis TaxID=2758441 RepID=A0A7W2FNS1_9VIBR|nr:helix-turn-helix transcriptional regulator [Vibrio marinisediminis]